MQSCAYQMLLVRLPVGQVVASYQVCRLWMGGCAHTHMLPVLSVAESEWESLEKLVGELEQLLSLLHPYVIQFIYK